MASGPARIVLSGLPREVAGILRRNLLAALIPAAVLGAAADVLVLVRHDLGGEIAVGIALAVAFELYVGYAELVVADDRDRRPHSPPRVLMRRALPAVPALTIASLAAVTLPLAATALLVLPGLWLLTRWSLFAPSIVHEGLSPRRALAHSTRLVRGAFWAVAASVTVSVVLEEVVIHAGVHAEPLIGVPGGGLVAAAVAVAVVSPPAAFTVSVVYERLAGAHSDARAGLPGYTGAPPSTRTAAAAGSGQ